MALNKIFSKARPFPFLIATTIQVLPKAFYKAAMKTLIQFASGGIMLSKTVAEQGVLIGVTVYTFHKSIKHFVKKLIDHGFWLDMLTLNN